MLRTIPFTIILGALMLFANTAEAASYSFSPGTGEFGLNKEISVDLKIDSEGTGINAGQATIRFPKDILNVKSISKDDSTFSFWLEEPNFSNETGVISFVGGTPYGISGSSVQIIRIVFTTKSSGTATVSIVDAAITSSDGSGSNVLSKTHDAGFTISPTKVAAVVVVPPTQIVREVAAASGLPSKPILSVPLYSDPALWYGASDVFTASWNLPADISGVSTAINKQPNYSPSESAGLFDSKMFEAIQDGTWYLHVRFRNSIGWGPSAHYRIGVDTKPPLPFVITSNESAVSDNPAPILDFKSSDTLSDIKEYSMRIDSSDLITIPGKDFKGEYKLPNQTPGKHHVIISAIDNAGNRIENSLDFEILPLALPTFTYITDKLYSDEVRGLALRGTALPSTEIILTLKKNDAVVSNTTIPVDANGNWGFTSESLLLSGNYIATIQNIDSRGALSLSVDSTTISITGRYTTFLIVLFIVLAGGLVAGFWYYKRRRAQTSLRIEMAERDTSNVFKMIQNDIQKLQDAQKTSTTVDDQFIAEKLKKNVDKMSSYITEEIGRAKK